MSEHNNVDDVPFTQRVLRNPRPLLVWGGVFIILIALEFGALVQGLLVIVHGIIDIYPWGNPGQQTIQSAMETARSIPTLLSREVIPNAGYQVSANGPWVETFPENLPYFDAGLEPKWAWLIRNFLVFGYALFLFGWVGYGYRLFRQNYRYADWTPRDDSVRRLRNHSWGKFGLVVVFLFITMAVFAPALGPTTVEKNIKQPYSYQQKYFDAETGEVEESYIGSMNGQSQSQGPGSPNITPWQYDKFGRWHPFGTLTNGKDLYTFMMAGARVSLFIGLLSIGISTILAAVFALLTAYHKGLVDLAVVVTGDSIMTIPQLLFVILVSAVFSSHWLGQVYSGGFLLALIFAFTGWPFLWRAVRGPAFQVSSQEWVDAARSYGQTATATMRKHMLPYIVGYLLVYGSMTLGGIIITTSALSFLGNGLGVQPPTPEWGRAVSLGEQYVATQSWHIAFIPGVMIVLVVTAFNALGDGIRDAIDPQSQGGETEAETVAAGGGGG